MIGQTWRFRQQNSKTGEFIVLILESLGHEHYECLTLYSCGPWERYRLAGEVMAHVVDGPSWERIA